MNWFEVKATYEKTMENGMQKKVTVPYLVDALSYAEAEARAIEELKPYISGEFTIASVRRLKIAELFFNENGDRFWKAKIQFVGMNEKTGAEKLTRTNMLVQATDIDNALAVLKQGGGYNGRLLDSRFVRNHNNGCIPISCTRQNKGLI
jgi:hypothetical protein